MRSSLILGITILTIAATSIVQAHPGYTSRSEHTCSLGPGTNACKCGEVVVKAAKTQKPLVYASPEAINEAAIARGAIGRFSAGTGSGSIASNVISNPYSSGVISTSSSSSSSSSQSSSSSSSSSVGVLGGSYSSFNTFLDDTSSNSGCGCRKKSGPVQVRDLLSDTNKQIVPSFPPIGDLCYPHKGQNGKIHATTKTKVTPAYPSKITCSSPTPEQVCVQVLNGQIDEADVNKLGLTAAYSGSSTASNELFQKLSSGNAFGSASSLGEYIFNNAGRTQYGSLGGYSSSGSVGGYSTYGSGYADSSVGNLEQFNSKFNSYGNKFGNDVEIAGSYSSNCGDFGDESELPTDYSYPRLPADPVSLTLAYKNLFPPLHMAYNKKLRFVPEDKLSFGHRTIPNETARKKKLDVPEEKLQILDKPVVELKPKSSVSITVGSYDEQEEAKLAELEAIERERINQEEIAEQQQRHFITYGDLGYMPINAALPGKLSNSLSADAVGTFEDDDRGCGPIGPPAIDYVPGTINREIVNDGEDGIQIDENYEQSDEEDEAEEYSSGIFARLRSSAQKYGLPCGLV